VITKGDQVSSSRDRHPRDGRTEARQEDSQNSKTHLQEGPLERRDTNEDADRKRPFAIVQKKRKETFNRWQEAGSRNRLLGS
jgi:hypothetical protein